MVLLGKRGLLVDWLKSETLSDFYFSLPFQWNKSKSNFVVKSDKKIKFHRARIICVATYLIPVICQIYVTREHSTRNVTVHSILFLTAISLGLITQHVNYKRRVGMVSLFNNLLDYERRQDSALKASKRSSILTRLLIWTQTSCGTCMPVLYHLNIIRNPCFPLNLGYWLSDQCETAKLGVAGPATWSTSEVMIKVAISLTSYFNWAFVFTGFCFEFAIELLVHGFCFQAYISNAGM